MKFLDSIVFFSRDCNPKSRYRFSLEVPVTAVVLATTDYTEFSLKFYEMRCYMLFHALCHHNQDGV